MATAQSTEWFQESLWMPPEVQITDIDSMPTKLSGQLDAQAGEKLLSRRHARETSKVIDNELATLLELFREESTLVDAVIGYAKDNGEDIEQLLEDVFPVITELVGRGFLMPKTLVEKQQPLAEYNAGEQFEDITIIRKIHHTDDTSLYMGQLADHSFVALKLASPDATDRMRPMFNHEARILKKLPDGITPELLENQSENDPPYLVIKWVSGNPIGQFAAKLRENKENNDHDLLLKLLTGVASSYENLHKAGWLHIDVHPGNILCNEQGKATLIDFGISQAIKNTRTIQAGINYFIAPESLEITNECTPGHLTEQYSIAAVLYLLATGQQYCDFSLRTDIMHKQLMEEPPRPFVDVDVPAWPELEAVLVKGLSKKTEDRYDDMSSFVSALKEINTSIPSSVAISPSQNNDTEKFIEHTFASLEETEILYTEGLPQGPHSSMNFGAAGIAYALYRFAISRNSPRLLNLAEKWSHKAYAWMDKKHAFKHPYFNEENKLITEQSIYNHLPGVYATSAFIANAKGDFGTLYSTIESLLKLTQNKQSEHDLALGAPGLAVLLISILETTGHALEQKQIRVIEKAIKKLIPKIKGKNLLLSASMTSRNKQNLGIAHGLAGRLYAALRWTKYKHRNISLELHSYIGHLLKHATPEGCGCCIPWQDDNKADQPTPFSTMSGWCNGSAGILLLLNLANSINHNKLYASEAEAFAQHCWQDLAEIPNLCCGLAGRAYALAEYSRQSNEHELWIMRAKQLINKAVTVSSSIDSREMPKHSLYKGQLGVALAAEELQSGEVFLMPFFTVEI